MLTATQLKSRASGWKSSALGKKFKASQSTNPNKKFWVRVEEDGGVATFLKSAEQASICIHPSRKFKSRKEDGEDSFRIRVVNSSSFVHCGDSGTSHHNFYKFKIISSICSELRVSFTL